MRGRFLLLAALFLLSFLPPAQADVLPGLDSDGDGEDDPCVSPGALLTDPENAIVIAKQCTVTLTDGFGVFTATVSYQQLEGGGVMITIAEEERDLVITIVKEAAENGGTVITLTVDYAEHRYECMTELPKVGDTMVWNACWRDYERWLA